MGAAPWVKILVLVASPAVVALVIYQLRVILTPFFLAFALAYLLDPAVDLLERLHLPRSGAIAVLLLGVAGATIALTLVISPTLRLQVETLAQALPGYVATIRAWLTPIIECLAQMDPVRVQTVSTGDLATV